MSDCEILKRLIDNKTNEINKLEYEYFKFKYEDIRIKLNQLNSQREDYKQEYNELNCEEKKVKPIKFRKVQGTLKI